MPTKTRVVLLMHPMEWKNERCTTGRITCLNLENSEIIVGLALDSHPRLRALLDDPANFCVLVYPGEGAWNLSKGPFPTSGECAGGECAWDIGGRRLVVLLVDATWACSRSMLRESPGLLRLPRVMFEPREPSRFYIKRQPKSWCLSTLEATHELLLALEAAGLDEYPDKSRLIDAFMAMQAYQVERKKAAPMPRHLGRAGD